MNISSPFPTMGNSNYFLPLYNCLLWISHKNGITKYVVIFYWLLSLSTMCSKSIHIVACISHSFLSSNEIPFNAQNAFLLLIHQLLGLGCLFLPLCYSESWCYRHSCLNFCVDVYFYLGGIYLGVELLVHMITLFIIL